MGQRPQRRMIVRMESGEEADLFMGKEDYFHGQYQEGINLARAWILQIDASIHYVYEPSSARLPVGHLDRPSLRYLTLSDTGHS